MSLSLSIPFLALLLLFLGAMARILIRAMAEIGTRHRWPRFIVGFVILGMLTSAPEFFVALQSAREGIPTLSLGNLLGASFVLLTLISGLAAVLYRGITLRRTLGFRNLMLVSLVILMPAILALDGRLTRADGATLILAFILYLFAITRWNSNHATEEAAPPLTRKTGTAWLAAGGSIVGLLVASALTVKVAKLIMTEFIAADFAIFPLIFGIVVLSIGTNIPELTLTIRTRLRGHRNIVLGDLVGSAATNTLIVGLLALTAPHAITDKEGIFIVAIFLAVALVAYNLFMRTKGRLSQAEGVAMLALYVIFLILEIATHAS